MSSVAFELQDELAALADLDTYQIPGDDDFSLDDCEQLLEAAVEEVATASETIATEDVFNTYRSLLKRSDQVPTTTMTKLLDSITSGLQAQLDATIASIETGDPQLYMAHKTPMEIYAFLLSWFVTAAEKVKANASAGDGASASTAAAPAPAKGRRGRGGKAGTAKSRAASSKKGASASETWDWAKQIPQTLSLICKVLLFHQLGRIWTSSGERDAFISCLTKPAFSLAESEAYMKVQDIRDHIFKIICLAVKHHNQVIHAQTTFMSHLQFYEHLSEPIADCLMILTTNFDFTQLGDEVLRDIASKNFANQEGKIPRSFAKFITKYAENCPRAVLKQFSLLQNQLDADCYPIRQAVIEAIGFLIKDLSTNPSSQDPKQVQKQIIALFELLLERVLDLSSYVRAKAFQVLAKLMHLKEHKFPKVRLALSQAAVAALEDKVSTVRKCAVGLLISLLKTHPYGIKGGMLDREAWHRDYVTVKEELKKIEGAIGNVDLANQDEEQKKGDDPMEVDGDTEPEDDEAEGSGNEEDGENEDDTMSVDGTPVQKVKKKKAKLAPRKSQLNLEALTQEQNALASLDMKHVDTLRAQAKYCKDAIIFIDTIESAMDLMCRLLGSSNKSEVLEVMEFLRVASEYDFFTAKTGIKKMLHLIWTKENTNNQTAAPEDKDNVSDKSIRGRLLEVYSKLYFEAVEGLSPKDNVNRIAKNLIELTYEATLAELTSLEEMMRIMAEEDQIHHDVIAKLWQVYSKEVQLPRIQRRGAIIILGMLAVARRTVIADKVDVMIKVGLGKLGKSDPTLARWTCVALQRLNGSAKKVKGSLQDKNLRYPMDHPIFRKLLSAVVHPCRTKEWFGMAEQAINAVFALGDRPDEWATELIKDLSVKAFGRTSGKPNDNSTAASTRAPSEAGDKPEDAEMADEDDADAKEVAGDVTMTQDPDTPTAAPDTDAGKNVGEAFELSQLLFVVGHVAIKQIVFLELVEREYKRQKDEKSAADKKAHEKNKGKDVEELDQIVGNAEDEIGDRIHAMRESELLFGDYSLLRVFGPMLVHICQQNRQFKNPILRAAATLSFSKFLCVSSQFCEEHHRLLFALLKTSKDANIKSNIVIALGDVAVSFSTIIDENSNELYKGLKDDKLIVKKNTLMVLTHLILNGMIKVKGQLGEMAKCLEDKDPRISDLAKLFFDELSTKDNAIYNNLPDVISHLSTGDHQVDEETFQNTIKTLFKYIEKERQVESIVEKLCQRFRFTEEPRQWRDIAYCLSLLPFKSERSVKKLIEGLQFYRDKLHEPVVFERFTEILTKARANKSKDKPDSELDEFSRILEEHRTQGAEDQALERRVETKKAAAAKKRGGGGGGGGAKKTTGTRGRKAAAAKAPANEDDMYSDA